MTLAKQGGSPLVIGFNTSAFRLLGLNAQQFLTPRNGMRAGSVEIEGHTYYYDGNSVFNRCIKQIPIELFLNTLNDIEDHKYAGGENPNNYCK